MLIKQRENLILNKRKFLKFSEKYVLLLCQKSSALNLNAKVVVLFSK